MSDERQEKGPRYLKVKEHIRARIASGEFGPGARVPSENELVSRFGLSRMTVNRALRELAADGWLKRRPGVGSFVRQPPARRAGTCEVRRYNRGKGGARWARWRKACY